MALPIQITFCVWFLSIFTSKFLLSLAQWDTYVIHMDLSSMPRAFTSHQNWYLSTLNSISDTKTTETSDFSSFSSKLVYAYSNAIHGFSAVLSPSELETIRNHPGFVHATKDRSVRKDTTHSSKFIGLNSNYGVWPNSGYGKDVIIGLVDTGVWPESKSYNDDGIAEVPSRWKGECEAGFQFNSSLCNKKLIGARYFNKGLLAKYPNLTISMNSTRDIDGHGTHTSSTAAGSSVQGASFFGYASGTATGMAPKARVAMYKALWEEGAYLSDIIAAIDAAIGDGVDVLSLSLGLDGVPLYEDPIAIATFAAMEKGIFVSTSAGNEGPFFGTLHNGIPWVLTVAAGTIDRQFNGMINLGNGISITGLTLYPGNVTSEKIPIVFNNACKSIEELKKLQGKIVVCFDNNQTLGEQVYNLQSTKGIAGGVFITNNTDLEFFLQSEFPAIFVDLQNGAKLLDFIKGTSPPKASLKFRGTQIGTKPAPMVASYSSRGPSQSCPNVLKPDLLAPGALVLASWPDKSPVTSITSGDLFNSFNIISGTSMSCPHAAGVGALLRGIHPDWSPAAIRSSLMTTADLLDNINHPITDIGFNGDSATPFAMGAGHINPNKALDPGLVYEAGTGDYINLLCAMNFTSLQIQSITRSSSYKCSNPSLDLNYPSFILYFRANSSQSTVKQFTRTVTNVGDGMAVYSAKLAPMDGFKVSVTPDKLIFRKKYEKQSYKLTVEGPTAATVDLVVYGSLSWEENGGKHVVRSPIAATSLTVQKLSA
ncbi:OLC1v1016788C1 [Oldenlandia corymbosa var. corymbosa]|uniref:OLC1v1016788C1 n=1 Tax=Oldenlandia corymbosa var. corymbosa TaxID=529605 RepID=A0AAV1E7Z0_OLDCO|nr:OLC1v1016788C1 [Oldenlandia corymbosa var. corymbosa]